MTDAELDQLAAEHGCQPAIELLSHLCQGHARPDAIRRYWLHWLASVYQRPALRLPSAIVMHGHNETGRRLFWRRLIMPLLVDRAVWLDQARLLNEEPLPASIALAIIDGDACRSPLKAVREKVNNFVFLDDGLMPTLLTDGNLQQAELWPISRLSPLEADQFLAELDATLIDDFRFFLQAIDISDFDRQRPPSNIISFGATKMQT